MYVAGFEFKVEEGKGTFPQLNRNIKLLTLNEQKMYIFFVIASYPEIGQYNNSKPIKKKKKGLFHILFNHASSFKCT